MAELPQVLTDDISPHIQPDFLGGRLLLRLSQDWCVPPTVEVISRGRTLQLKGEFHVTLLNENTGRALVAEIGEDAIAAAFAAHEWSIRRTGDGVLLGKDKLKDGRFTECLSIIELVDLPDLQRIRDLLAHSASIELPRTPAHVTLYAAGDPAGIGLPSYEALDDAAVAKFRLPGVRPRLPPPLSAELHAAYCDAIYAIDGLAATVRIGERCSIVDEAFVSREVGRASIVTAYNPFSQTSDSLGNELRQQWLISALAAKGLTAEKAEGRDPFGKWDAEPSVLVFGSTPDLEDRLMQDFEQHAMVVLEFGQPARLKLHPHHGR